MNNDNMFFERYMKMKRERRILCRKLVLISTYAIFITILCIVLMVCYPTESKVAEVEAISVKPVETVVSEEIVEVKQLISEEYVATAYCDCETCCGKTDGITKSGTIATEGRTIAVDPNKIPLGSKVEIEGLGVRIAEDTGSAIKGKKVDIFFNNHSDALEFGRRTVNLTVIEDE